MFFFCLWIVVRCFFFLYWPLRPSYLTWINSSETWILTSYSGPAPPVTAKCHCLDLEETEKNLNLRLISYLGFPILKAARQVQQHLPPPIKKNLKYYSKKKNLYRLAGRAHSSFFFLFIVQCNRVLFFGPTPVPPPSLLFDVIRRFGSASLLLFEFFFPVSVVPSERRKERKKIAKTRVYFLSLSTMHFSPFSRCWQLFSLTAAAECCEKEAKINQWWMFATFSVDFFLSYICKYFFS